MTASVNQAADLSPAGSHPFRRRRWPWFWYAISWRKEGGGANCRITPFTGDSHERGADESVCGNWEESPVTIIFIIPATNQQSADGRKNVLIDRAGEKKHQSSLATGIMCAGY